MHAAADSKVCMWSHILIVKRRTGALQIPDIFFLPFSQPTKQRIICWLLFSLLPHYSLQFTCFLLLMRLFIIYSLLIHSYLVIVVSAPDDMCSSTVANIARISHHNYFFTLNILNKFIRYNTNNWQMRQHLINLEDWENHLEDSCLFTHCS